MSSPIERLYGLKYTAQTKGFRIEQLRFVVSTAFMEELLADPSVRWVLPGTFKRGPKKVFGIPIEESSDAAIDLRLSVELDG